MKTRVIVTILIFVVLGELPAYSYTGLIIDAHGLDIRPTMSPKIFDEEGTEIYGTVEVCPEFVIEKGILGYANSIKEAIDEDIVGEHPLIVRALRLDDDPINGNLIISEEDGKLIITENMINGFLYDYKVAIVW